MASPSSADPAAPEAVPPERTPELTFDVVRSLWAGCETDGRHPDPTPSPLMLATLKMFAEVVLMRDAGVRADLVRAATTGSTEETELPDPAVFGSHNPDNPLRRWWKHEPFTAHADFTRLVDQERERVASAVYAAVTSVKDGTYGGGLVCAPEEMGLDRLCDAVVYAVLAALRSSAPAPATEPSEAAIRDAAVRFCRVGANVCPGSTACDHRACNPSTCGCAALATALGSSAPAPGGATEDGLDVLNRARREVNALCQGRGHPGGRNWTMSIPARPDDSDLTIVAALDVAEAALSKLRAADRTREDAGEPANSGEAR